MEPAKKGWGEEIQDGIQKGIDGKLLILFIKIMLFLLFVNSRYDSWKLYEVYQPDGIVVVGLTQVLFSRVRYQPSIF